MHTHLLILLPHLPSPWTHGAFVRSSHGRSAQYFFAPSRGPSHASPTSPFFSFYRLCGFFSDAPGSSAWFHWSRRDCGAFGWESALLSNPWLRAI